MLEPQNNEALKIETARRRTGLIRQYLNGPGRDRGLHGSSCGRFSSLMFKCSVNASFAASPTFHDQVSLVVLFRRFPVGNADQNLDLIRFEGAAA